MADERTVADIERDLAQARQRLTDNLSQLVTAVHPKAVAHRSIMGARRKLLGSLTQISSRLRDEVGWKQVSVVVGAAVVVVVVVVIIKKK